MSDTRKQWLDEADEILRQAESKNSLFRTGFSIGYLKAKEGTETLETQIQMLTSDQRTKLVMARFGELNEDHKKLITQLMGLLKQIKEEA